MEAKNHRMLEKSLAILEYISRHTEGKTLLEITDYAELPKSSVHNILQTFLNLGYINRDRKSNLYTLGLRAFELGTRYIEKDELFRACKDVLKVITRETEETSHFGILDGSEVVYIHKNESTQPIRMVSNIGKRNPAHATALGKALLSGLTDEEIIQLYENQSLAGLTDKTVTALEALLKQVEEIRKTGIAYESEESTPNVQCVAVPVKQKNGNVVAAISVSIPIFRIQKDLSSYIASLQAGARELERFTT